MSKDNNRSKVQSLDRVVAILRCFSAQRSHLGVTEIANTTGLSTSTVHRLLSAMSDNELVYQNSAHRYSLGPLVVQLARNGGIPTTLRDTAYPVMINLRDRVHETVGLHELLPNGHRAVIDQVESHQALRRIYTEFGKPIKLQFGSPGRAILAYLSEERQKWSVFEDFYPNDMHIPLEPEEVWADLAATRSRGWARPMGERTPGIRGVASPLFDHTGTPVGSLSISAPSVRMSDERVSEVLGPEVAAAAWGISKALGASHKPYPAG